MKKLVKSFWLSIVLMLCISTKVLGAEDVVAIEENGNVVLAVNLDSVETSAESATEKYEAPKKLRWFFGRLYK